MNKPCIVLVTDANLCTKSVAFSITESATLLNIDLNTKTNLLCNGATTGAASVTVSGGTSPYSYAWSNGVTSTSESATNLAAGTYTVTVKDANLCEKTFDIVWQCSFRFHFDKGLMTSYRKGTFLIYLNIFPSLIYRMSLLQ